MSSTICRTLQIADQARQVLAACEKSPSDAVQLRYDPRNPFDICALTFTPIYRGSKFAEDPYTGARFQPECAGQVRKMALVSVMLCVDVGGTYAVMLVWVTPAVSTETLELPTGVRAVGGLVALIRQTCDPKSIMRFYAGEPHRRYGAHWRRRLRPSHLTHPSAVRRRPAAAGH